MGRLMQVSARARTRCAGGPDGHDMAQGEETLVDLEVTAQDRTICWHERRLIISLIDAKKAAHIRVHQQLGKAEKAIGE